jgi:hypothetical protein
MIRIARVLPLIAALGLLSSASADDSKPDPKKKVVEDVLARLKEKRERGWNERYKLAVEATTGLANGAGNKCHEQRDFQVDWKTGKFRLESVTTCLNPHEGVEIYDGKQLKTHFRLLNEDKTPKGAWRYGLNTGTHEGRVFVSHFWPIFFNRGVLIASSMHSFHPGHFTFDLPDASALFVHKQAGAGGRLVTLRTFPENPARQSYFEYTFDLDKDCGVTEFRWSQDGEIATRIEIELKNWEKRWAPSGWTVTGYAKKVPSSVTKVTVNSFAPDVPVTDENAYDIVPPEGAKVGRTDYQPTGKPHQSKVESYEYVVRDGELVQTSGPTVSLWQRLSAWRWLLAGVAFGVVGGLVVRRFALRRKG